MKGFFDDIIDLVRKNGRVEELKQVAKVNGFKFKNKESWASQDYLLKSFSIFKGKKDKRMKGILRKEILPLEAQIRIYDYIYFGDLKTKKTTVFEIECKDLQLPRFEIHPKGFFKKVSEFFVDSDKPYAKDSEFHGKFEIQTKSSQAFEDALNVHFLDFILEKKLISAEGKGDYLILFADNKLTTERCLIMQYR